MDVYIERYQMDGQMDGQESGVVENLCPGQMPLWAQVTQ